MRPRPAAGVLASMLAAAVALSGCTASGPTVDGVVIRTPAVDPQNPPVDPPYGSGVLDVFDDVAELVPGIAELRSEVAADDAAFGERILAELADGAEEPVALPAIAPDGPTRGAARAADDEVLDGAYLFGLFAGTVVSDTTGLDRTRALALGETGANDDGTIRVTRTDSANADIEVSQVAEKRSPSGATVRTDFRAKVEGVVCPAADGEFDVRIRLHHQVDGSADGSSAGATEDLIASMTGRLGEDSAPERMHLSTSHRSTETREDGSSITVATRQQKDATDPADMLSAGTAPVELIERSKDATDADVKRLTERGQSRAAGLLVGQISSMLTMWRSGGCVTLDAQAPAVVKPGSVTDIPVEVTSKLGGDAVATKTALVLTGAESISAGEVRTPGGRFSYTAPGEIGSSARISLTATSRRGGATLDLTISTGGAHFAVSGGEGIFAGTGEWCEGASTFSIVGAKGTTILTLFGVEGGDVQYVGADGATGYQLGGTWTTRTDDRDQPLELRVEYQGLAYTATGPRSFSGLAYFAVTPKERCDAE